MKLMKRTGIYKANNVTFNPETKKAYSYSWWQFVGLIEGKLVFNTHTYSPSTTRHQYKVRRLLEQLGIKIDIEMPLQCGLPDTYHRYGQQSPVKTLQECIEYAETELCNKFLAQKLKAQETYQRNKLKRALKAKEAIEAKLGHVADCTALYKQLDAANAVINNTEEV